MVRKRFFFSHFLFQMYLTIFCGTETHFSPPRRMVVYKKKAHFQFHSRYLFPRFRVKTLRRHNTTYFHVKFELWEHYILQRSGLSIHAALAFFPFFLDKKMTNEKKLEIKSEKQQNTKLEKSADTLPSKKFRSGSKMQRIFQPNKKVVNNTWNTFACFYFSSFHFIAKKSLVLVLLPSSPSAEI